MMQPREGTQMVLSREEIKDYMGCLREGILAEVMDNALGHILGAPAISPLLILDVNDYETADGEDFNAEAWDDRQGYIYAPATRENWKVCYRIARALVKGPVTLTDKGNMKLELPGIITVNC
jgi:hypothetical protein